MNHKRHGFTIVELLIVIVVIGILATISIVAYNGITQNAEISSLKSDLRNAASKLATLQKGGALYPSSLPDEIKASGQNTLTYSSDGSTFCLVATSPSGSVPSFYVADNQPITEGACDMIIGNGSYMQNITSENCPAGRVRAVDARDNHTYWVQKLTDKCWMLTSLGYEGGGNNTYGDVKTLTNGTGLSSTFTAPRYYAHPGTTYYTVEPASPSAATNGTGHYGYLYNWCAAMGGQSTAACAEATTPAVDPSVSICPAGWRLPTGGSDGEFGDLNAAVNGGLTNTNEGLRTNWLAQMSGAWQGGFIAEGVFVYYWSSLPDNSVTYSAYWFHFGSTYVVYNNGPKFTGAQVRCVTV